MTDPIDVLRTGLASTYAIQREIGRGGMSLVYLARDRRRDRLVALKILRPELRAAVGLARFLQEIEIASKLSHPHILPLYDSGEVEGQLYYVMPYVEGESLRARLEREQQMSLESALRVTEQVAHALDYAHLRGIVHRDIKPENILLSGGIAQVADFGIARAVTVAGGDRLTATGVVIGSPLYMSPEQAAGDDEVDPRSDIYSLACVTYEMLAGAPPFTGRTARAILARHALEPYPNVRTVRPAATLAMDAALARALQKVPADRFERASEFVAAFSAPASEGIAPRAPRIRPGSVSLRHWTAFTLGAFAIAAGVWMVAGRNGHATASPDIIAIAPFRPVGAADSSAALITSSLQDLIYQGISGEGGLNAVDPALVRSRWPGKKTGSASPELTMQQQVQSVLRMGASRALLGTFVQSMGTLHLSVAVVSVPTGREILRIPDVSGPTSDLPTLANRTSAELLARLAGVPEFRMPVMAKAKLPALRAYLAAQEDIRRGRYRNATQQLDSAMAVDSVFPLPALSLAMVEAITEPLVGDRAPGILHAKRNEFVGSDTLLVLAHTGLRYPAPTSYAEQMHLWERVVTYAPKYWEGYYELANLLLRWGPAVGGQDARSLAGQVARHALASDSTSAPVLELSIDLAAANWNFNEVERLWKVYRTANPSADNRDYIAWRAAVALRDERTLAALRSRWNYLDSGTLQRIEAVAQLDGVALDDAAKAAGEVRRRAKSQVDLLFASMANRELALNRGRPKEAVTLTAESPLTLPVNPLLRVIEALYWNGDTAVAAAAALERSPGARAPLPLLAAATASEFMDACTVGLWDLAHSHFSAAAEAVRRLRTARSASERTETAYIPVCASTLDAGIAIGQKSNDGPAKVAELDSLLKAGPVTNSYILLAARSTLARLWNALGHREKSLAAVQRRPYHYSTFGVAGLSAELATEGKLSEALGDNETAVRAYRHYLALRGADYESTVATEVDSIRNRLTYLLPRVSKPRN